MDISIYAWLVLNPRSWVNLPKTKRGDVEDTSSSRRARAHQRKKSLTRAAFYTGK